MNSEQISAELRRIHFVHCAIPDISLDRVRTDFAIGNIRLDEPIVVLADDKDDAREIVKHENALPVVFLDGESMRMVEGNGKNVMLDHDCHLVKVGDGLMAAKILRYDAKAVPYIPKSEIKNAEMYLQQLKVAMFLTNSKDIEAMRSAPIYIV